MIDINKPVQLSTGQEARIIGELKGTAYPIAVAIKSPSTGVERLEQYDLDGYPPVFTQPKLINTPDMSMMYISLFQNRDGVLWSDSKYSLSDSKSPVDRITASGSTYLGRVMVAKLNNHHKGMSVTVLENLFSNEVDPIFISANKGDK